MSQVLGEINTSQTSVVLFFNGVIKSTIFEIHPEKLDLNGLILKKGGCNGTLRDIKHC